MTLQVRRGTCVAEALLVRGLAATSCLLMGCLITDDIEFPDEPVCPPAISTPVGANNPLNEIAQVTLGPSSGEDAGVGSREETFDVTVWDCNVDQALDFIVLVNAQPDVPGAQFGTLFRTGTIESQGTPERTFSFTFTEDELTNPDVFGERCHKVELFVSAEFESFSTRPRSAGDLGTATWWLIVDTTPAAGADPTCP